MLLILIPYFHIWMLLVGDGGMRLEYPDSSHLFDDRLQLRQISPGFYRLNKGLGVRSPSCTQQPEKGVLACFTYVLWCIIFT